MPDLPQGLISRRKPFFQIRHSKIAAQFSQPGKVGLGKVLIKERRE